MLHGAGVAALAGEEAVLGGTEPAGLLADPTRFRLRVARGASAQVAVTHTKEGASALDIELEEGAVLRMVDLSTAGTAACRVRQAAGSRCEIVSAALGSAEVSYRVRLDGPHASSKIDGLFLACGGERVSVEVRVDHSRPDCTSESLVKGVVSGEAQGRFDGLVYVAPDAQRADARQTSRNVELSPRARIVTRPQLEIYADDVKCSHGATVGRMDDEAVLYMRQRGLSEAQARRLQMEGFVSEVVMHCTAEPFREGLRAVVLEKLETL